MQNQSKYFLSYQYRWITDNSPLKIIQKSRQVGISYAEAYRWPGNRGAEVPLRVEPEGEIKIKIWRIFEGGDSHGLAAED